MSNNPATKTSPTPWLSKPARAKALALALLLLAVLGWRACLLWRQPAHLREMAHAYGTSGLVYGAPQLSPDGRQMLFCQMEESGLGVFVLDTQTGAKRLVHEKVSTDDWFETVDVWPWSPDGRFLLYTHTNLFVCEASSGQPAGRVRVDGLNGVASLVWLTPRSFVYVSKAGNLHRIEQDAKGQWRELPPSGLKAGSEGLTALSSNTICWQHANRVWSLNLDTRVANVLFDARKDQLDSFAYSPKNGQFWLSCATPSGPVVRRVEPRGGLIQFQAPLAAPARRLHSLDSEKGLCAYIGAAPEKSQARSLEVLLNFTSAPVRLFEQGSVEALTATSDGRKLFAVGVMSNEPAAGIWEYDVDTGKTRCVVSSQSSPSAHLARVSARQETVNLGPKVNYYVYEPAAVDPQARRRYPLVIGDTLYRALDPAYQNRVHGPYWAPMLANAGAFVVIVDRPGAWFNEMGDWVRNVDWTVRKMLRNPAIDPARVYLFATSAETVELTKLAEKQPGLWKGLILLSPTRLPDLKTLSAARTPPKILISQGSLEGTKYSLRYQQEALPLGVQVECRFHPQCAHILLGTRALNQRAEAMMEFVFGD